MSTDAERVRLLLDAIEREQASQMTSLLDKGKVTVDSADAEGVTPLMVASAIGNEHIVRILIKRGAKIDQRSVYGWTALMQASCYGSLPIVGLLLQHRANPNVTNVWGATALSCACRNGHVAIASLLLDAESTVNGYASAHADAATPLMIAAQHGHDDIVRMLVSRDADVDARLVDVGWNALMLAATNCEPSACRTLVEMGGAKAELRNACGLTALDVAIAQRSVDVERYLEKKTVAKPKRLTKTVHIDIFESAKGGYVKRMREILGADQSHANLTDDDGATPLMFAAMKGHVESAALLLENGAKINAQDNISKWTALMQAVYYGRKEMTRLLIDHDADAMIKARDGNSAFDMASIIGDTEVVRMLAAVSMKVSTTKKGGGGNRSPHHPNRVIHRNKHVPAPRQHTTVLDSSDDGSSLKDDKLPTRLQSWWSRMSSRFKKMKFGKTGGSMTSTQLETLTPTSPSRGSSASSGHRTPVSRKSSSSTRGGGGGGEQKSSGSGEKEVVVVGTSESETEQTPESSTKRRKSSKTQSVGGTSATSRKSSRRKASLTRHVPTAPQLPQDVLTPIIPPFLPAATFEFNSVGLDGSGRLRGLPPHRHRGSTGSAGNHARGMVRPSKYTRSVSESTAPSTPSLYPPSGPGLLSHRGGGGANFSELSNSGNSGAESSTLTVGSMGSSPASPIGTDSVFSSPYRSTAAARSGIKTFSSSSHSPGSSMSSTLVASSSVQQRAMRGYGRVPGSSVYSSDTESTLVASLQQQHLPYRKQLSSPTISSPREEDELNVLMRKLSLENYTPIFEEQEVDMEAFLTLSDGDLRELGISSVEPRRQILSAISGLKSEKRRERRRLRETVRNYRQTVDPPPPPPPASSQSQPFESGAGW